MGEQFRAAAINEHLCAMACQRLNNQVCDQIWTDVLVWGCSEKGCRKSQIGCSEPNRRTHLSFATVSKMTAQGTFTTVSKEDILIVP